MHPKIIQAQVLGTKAPPLRLSLVLRTIGGCVTQNRIREDHAATARARKFAARDRAKRM